MEIWQIAALLGADEPQKAGIDPELWEREKDTLAQRAAAISKKEPVSADQEEDITAMVMGQMGIRTK